MLENHSRRNFLIFIFLEFVVLNASRINYTHNSVEINFENNLTDFANLSNILHKENVTIPSLTDFVTIPSLPNVTIPSLTDFVTIPSLTNFVTLPNFTFPSLTNFFTIPSIPSITDLFTIPSIPSITDFITIPTLNDLYDYFDVDNIKDTFIPDTLKFPLSNLTFYKVPSLKDVLPVNLIKVRGNELANHAECSFLPLDKSLSVEYSIMKPKKDSPGAIELGFCSIKMPFTNLLSNSPFASLKYCIAFNKKTFGIGFDKLQVPCLPDPQMCSLKFRGISLSNEGRLIDEGKTDVVIFDGLRSQIIPRMNNFALQMSLAMPNLEKEATFYPSDNSNKKGFLVKISTDLNVFSQFNRDMNLFYFRTDGFKLDVFINGKQLVKYTFDLTITGALRDSRTNLVNLCYPSGIYMNVKLEIDNLGKFWSFSLNDLNPITFIPYQFI